MEISSRRDDQVQNWGRQWIELNIFDESANFPTHFPFVFIAVDFARILFVRGFRRSTLRDVEIEMTHTPKILLKKSSHTERVHFRKWWIEI